MKFSKAIVRKPCPQMIRGITTASMGAPDYRLALEQHSRYTEALRTCGLEVRVLGPKPRFPDSTFVEDVALCTPACAIVTNPGAPSRNGEKASMKDVLRAYYLQVETIEDPGTLDAGDVMMAGNHYYIGISDRTNPEGALQLTRILERYGMTSTHVPLGDMLHLKSGVSFLENDHILVAGALRNHPAFKGFHKIEVDPYEAYAANSLWINGTVLVPSGFPKTREKVEKAGYRTIALEVSEFQKLDGGLSCLSLRF